MDSPTRQNVSHWVILIGAAATAFMLQAVSGAVAPPWGGWAALLANGLTTVVAALFGLRIDRERRKADAVVSSPVAQAVLEKQIAFAEEYAGIVTDAVLSYQRNYATSALGDFCGPLVMLRAKYALWLPVELSRKLSEFEKSLMEIDNFVFDLRHRTPDVDLVKASQELRKKCGDVFGRGILADPGTEGVDGSFFAVFFELRRILGVESATTGRTALFRN